MLAFADLTGIKTVINFLKEAFVRYDAEQFLTSQQKDRARTNIGLETLDEDGVQSLFEKSCSYCAGKLVVADDFYRVMGYSITCLYADGTSETFDLTNPIYSIGFDKLSKLPSGCLQFRGFVETNFDLSVTNLIEVSHEITTDIATSTFANGNALDRNLLPSEDVFTFGLADDLSEDATASISVKEGTDAAALLIDVTKATSGKFSFVSVEINGSDTTLYIGKRVVAAMSSLTADPKSFKVYATSDDESYYSEEYYSAANLSIEYVPAEERLRGHLLCTIIDETQDAVFRWH